MGNNSRVEAKGIGTCTLTLRGGHILLLHDVLYAPEIRRKLISIHVLLELGYHLTFHGVCLKIFLNLVIIETGHLINGFFVLDTILDDSSNDNNCFLYITSSSTNEIYVITWHTRLACIGKEIMYRLARKGMLDPLTKIDLPIYENCLTGKTIKKPFSKGIRAEKLLQLIHSDICGPINVRTKHGASCFITFIDDYSCFNHVYLIYHKSEASTCFRLYVNMVENQLDNNVKALRTYR